MRTLTLSLVALMVALTMGQGNWAKPPKTPTKPKPAATKKPLQPSPKQTPEQVIGIVLQALKANDKPKKDSGIEVTFRFASPQNKRMTGPLNRFTAMVKTPPYHPMLNYKSVQRKPIALQGDTARQEVTLVAANGEKVTYFFGLSRQKSGPYKGCWMTDSVLRVPSAILPRERSFHDMM